MDHNAKSRIRSGPALAVLFLVGFVVGYPLSVGPAALIYRVAGEPPLLDSLFQTIYGPLEILPKPVQTSTGGPPPVPQSRRPNHASITRARRADRGVELRSVSAVVSVGVRYW